jgi:hypothetical protein
MPMTRRQGITNRSKAKSQNARKRGPTPGFPAKSNTLSRQLLPISQGDLHSSRTTIYAEIERRGAGCIAKLRVGKQAKPEILSAQRCGSGDRHAPSQVVRPLN